MKNDVSWATLTSVTIMLVTVTALISTAPAYADTNCGPPNCLGVHWAPSRYAVGLVVYYYVPDGIYIDATGFSVRLTRPECGDGPILC
jgi:hypothetical protein